MKSRFARFAKWFGIAMFLVLLCYFVWQNFDLTEAKTHPIRQIYNAVKSGIWAAIITACTTFVIKTLPTALWKWLAFEFRYEMKASAPQTPILKKWLKSRPFARRTNSFTLSKALEFELGYGSYWYWDRGPVLVKFEKAEDSDPNQGTKPDELRIYALKGFKKGFLEYITAERGNRSEEQVVKEIDVEIWRNRDWVCQGGVTKRPLSSIYIPDDQKDEILKSAQWFYENQEWFADRHIPYRFGMLFYGVPGTGKTSLVRALASELKKSLYILSLASLEDDDELNEALTYVGSGIILLEDIDACGLSATRKTGRKTENDGKVRRSITMAGLLNAIDGIAAREGRMLCMTTNHKDQLEPALIRSARVDKVFEIKPLEPQLVFAMANHFFPDDPRYALDCLEKAEKGELLPACEWQGRFIDRARELRGHTPDGV